ncbi:MAG TPA: murein biosynthesis integral membrane protein MurJ [Xanthobacteraceae bacterium]|nr:murein biosynthesis integral membrane protein MurJ [Xanthobacteraceae bacterium]
MSLARKLATVGTATLLSRLLGFARDAGIAFVLGAGVLSDALFAALLVPNLFRRLLAEGALNSAFVPIWLRLRRSGGKDATQAFGNGVLGAMLLVLGALVVIGIWFAPDIVRLVAPGFDVGGERFALAVTCLRLSLPYVAIAGAVAVAASVLNAEGHVGAVSFGLIVYNVVLVAAVGFVAVWGPKDRVQILSAAVALAGIAQFAVVGAAMAHLPAAPLRPHLPPSAEARRMFARALPGIIAAGIPQLKLIAGAIVASSSPSAVSWLYYAYRLYELPLGVVSVAIASVMAPLLAASLQESGPSAAAMQSRAFEIALGVALPAAIGLSVLAHPIAAGLFEHGAFGPGDTLAVAAALAAIAAGLPGHALEKVLASICFAHEDTRTPMTAACAGLTTAVLGALWLFPTLGHVGIAAAIAASGWVGAALLSVILARRRWLLVDGDARRRLPRIVLAAAFMGLVVFAADRMLTGAMAHAGLVLRLTLLALLVTCGLLVYLLGLQALGTVPLRHMAAALRGRASRA